MKSLFLSFLMCMTATVAFALDVTGLRTEDYHNPVGLEVRKAYRQEMNCLVDEIYKVNKPRKHRFLLRRL